MSIYLVTGAAGFVGSAITRELVSRGEVVRGVDNFETGKPENLAEVIDRVEFHELDILDYQKLSRVCAGVDFILHQAALPSVPLSIVDPVRSHRINIDGTLNVLLAARDAKVKRVVYAASSSAYGETLVLPKQETMLPDPLSPYAVQKLTGELYMRCFAKVYNLETVCLRYFNLFGPRQDSNSPYSGVVAKFITSMLQAETPTIYGDGEQTRDFTYVDNAVAANLAAAVATKDGVVGGCFNIGIGQCLSLNLMFQTLRTITGFTGNPKYLPARIGDVRHSQADITQAQAHLNYSPKVSFKEGLERTVEWYRTQMPALTIAAQAQPTASSTTS